MQLPKHIEEAIASIASDTIHGAEILTQRSIEVFRSIPRDARDLRAAELHELVRQTVKLLVSAQPAMASIANVANTFLWNTEGIEDGATLRSAIIRIGEQLSRSGKDNLRSIAERASLMIEPGNIVITHSRSETVSQTLLNARKSGKEFTVYCTESAPMMEGIALAKELGEAGIKVNLFSDDAILGQIARAQLVLVGADSVSARGVVNKVGTQSIARASHRAQVPCFALCSSLKFAAWETVQPADSRRSWFDTTPLDVLSGIVTESGSLSPPQVLQQLANTKIHPFLLTTISAKSR